jgi:hypothetical protein
MPRAAQRVMHKADTPMFACVETLNTFLCRRQLVCKAFT